MPTGRTLVLCSFSGWADALPEEAFDAPERFVTAAIDANVALYPVDARGVVAVIPFGDATTTTGEMNPGGSVRHHNQWQARFRRRIAGWLRPTGSEISGSTDRRSRDFPLQ